MNQIFDLLVWLGSGIILLFVFLVIVDRNMKARARDRGRDSREMGDIPGSSEPLESHDER